VEFGKRGHTGGIGASEGSNVQLIGRRRRRSMKKYVLHDFIDIKLNDVIVDGMNGVKGDDIIGTSMRTG